jgi:hypothetical protein
LQLDKLDVKDEILPFVLGKANKGSGHKVIVH